MSVAPLNLAWASETHVRGTSSALREPDWLTADRLDALSPLGTLRRGYAVPLGVEGEVLRRLAMFRTGGTFRLRVVDGVVHCTAEETEDLEAELEE